MLSGCTPARAEVFPSPDGTHEARLTNQDCYGSVAYWITVIDKAAWLGGSTKVLLTWDFPPDVAWRDDRHLAITIQRVSHFDMSLHQAGEISIAYRLADQLFEENFRKDIEDLERRWADLLRQRRGTIVGNQDKDPKALKEDIAHMWDEYHQFKAWAKDNAENGGS